MKNKAKKLLLLQMKSSLKKNETPEELTLGQNNNCCLSTSNSIAQNEESCQEQVPSVFETLSKVNVNDKVESKNNMKYLSWAFAWGETKKRFANANYTVYETPTITITTN